MAVTKRELGEILLAADLINSTQLDDALGLQKKSGERLASLLVRKRILTERVGVLQPELLTQPQCYYLALDKAVR